MPRYYFEIQEDEKSFRDDEGLDQPNLEAVRREAMKALPQIASDQIPKGGDRQTFLCLVTDEDEYPVYSGTLSYVGQWLLRAQP